jgi:micrococcal nuclease
MKTFLFVISSLVFFASMPALVVGLIAPRVFGRFFKGGVTRWQVGRTIAAVMVVSFVLVAVTVEPSEQPAGGSEQAPFAADETSTDTLGANTEAQADAGAVQSGDASDAADTSTVAVIKVVDGDTVAVNIADKSETIRIIGINTPETVDPRKPVECFGQEASAKAHELLDGKSVILEADATQGERDKYGRLLRYVFLPDGSDFGKTMISEGYAYEYTYSTPYKYQEAYKAAQGEAQTAKRGLWADGVCDEVEAETETPTSSTSQAETQAAESDTATNEDSTSEPVTAAPTESADDSTTGTTTDTVTNTEPSPSTTTASCSCSSNSYNCGDFSTHAEAQAIYDCCMAQVGYDVHGLDSDKDSSACESLP